MRRRPGAARYGWRRGLAVLTASALAACGGGTGGGEETGGGGTAAGATAGGGRGGGGTAAAPTTGGTVAGTALEAGRPLVLRLNPLLEAIVPGGAVLERVAGGFTWLEGPLWDPVDASLLFSEVPSNSVYRVRPGGEPELFLRPSGYTAAVPFGGREPGSNGLAWDRDGRLVLCQHGDRRVARLSADGRFETLADRYRGRRLNSPNDVVSSPAGDLLFTDPPFGLPVSFEDPGKELPFQGVYRLSPDGGLTLLTDAVRAPNGLALSPDGGTLYVSNAERSEAIVFAFPVLPDGSLGDRRIFFDLGAWVRDALGGAPDGLEVDREGNVYVAGPGGVHVVAPDGTELGVLWPGAVTSNSAWGEDGSTLFLTASEGVWRIRLATRGAGY